MQSAQTHSHHHVQCSLFPLPCAHSHTRAYIQSHKPVTTAEKAASHRLSKFSQTSLCCGATDQTVKTGLRINACAGKSYGKAGDMLAMLHLLTLWPVQHGEHEPLCMLWSQAVKVRFYSVRSGVTWGQIETPAANRVFRRYETWLLPAFTLLWYTPSFHSSRFTVILQVELISDMGDSFVKHSGKPRISIGAFTSCWLTGGI